MRAHYLSLAWSALEAGDPSLAARARQCLADSRAELERARGLQWLPIEHLLAMSELAFELGGAECTRALVLDTMGAALGSPLWGRILRMTIGAFGLGPAAVVRWAPGVYRLAFRGTGAMRVPQQAPGRAEVVFEGVPPQCLAAEPYLAALGYALEYFLVLTERQGSVTLLGCEEGRVRYLVQYALPD